MINLLCCGKKAKRTIRLEGGGYVWDTSLLLTKLSPEDHLEAPLQSLEKIKHTLKKMTAQRM
jgi:hypothetical protein